MGCISQLLAGVTAAVVGALLAMMFQAQIVRYFSPDRLVAEITSGPWQPIPLTKGDGQDTYNLSTLKPYAIKNAPKASDLHIVQMDISNPGAKTVQNIRIFMGRSPPERISIYKDGALVDVVEGENTLNLKPLAPGEAIRAAFWTEFNPDNYYFSDWKTFSSEGPIVLRIKSYQDASLNTETEDLIGSIIEWVFFLGIAAGIFLLIVWVIAFYSYVTELMKSEDRYLEEKLRYDANPKKFSPQTK